MKSFEKWLREKVQKTSDNCLKWCLIVFGIVTLFAIFNVETLKKIEIGSISNIANTVDNFDVPFLDIFENTFIKSLIFALFGITLYLRIYKFLIRPRAKIIKHSSFSNAQSSYDPSIVTGYSVTEKEINVVEQMAHHNIVDAIRKQDSLIEEILNSCDPHTELVYYGIAHTPLIFRAGFQVGDEGRVRLLHKYRNEQSFFREISSDPDTFSVKMEPIKVQSTKPSKEMLVVIATSLQIKDEDLVCFQNNNYCCRLYFQPKESGMYGFDSVVSYATMERLKTDILQEIRENVTIKGVQKVHLVLSTSSDFTFSLAQGFSKNHDPEIVVYHYDRNSDTKYPWGISNIASPANAVVRHSLQAPVD